MMTDPKENSDFIYKELSYKLIGFAYEVYSSIGKGLKEQIYKDAYAKVLETEEISFKREVFYPVKIRDKVSTRRYFDFLIEDKIVIEFKVGERGYFDCFNQLLEYLKISNFKLGIIIRFTLDGVRIKRIPNLY